MLYQFWKSEGIWRRILTIVLSVAIVSTVIAIIVITRQPMVGDKFTEFYILGLKGKAGEYPREMILGEEGRVILGVVNREYKVTDYKVEIAIDGEMVGAVGPITLEHEEKWEHEVVFVPTRAGPNQKVEFLFYKGEHSQLYGTLHLWTDVKEAP